MSLGFPNTVLNTIVAEAIDDLADELKKELDGAKDIAAATAAIVKKVWNEDKEIVFGGDGYSEEWHKEAEKRGLLNLPTTPDALPWYHGQADCRRRSRSTRSSTSASSRPASRSAVEQYISKANIEAETAATHRAHDDPARGNPPRAARR